MYLAFPISKGSLVKLAKFFLFHRQIIQKIDQPLGVKETEMVVILFFFLIG